MQNSPEKEHSLKLSRVLQPPFWNRMSAEWLSSRGAAVLFSCSTLLVIALIPVSPLGIVNVGQLSGLSRLAWDILAVVGTMGLFFLWFGMWKFWSHVDNSTRTAKRAWFVVLLLGFWYGSCLYCWFVYLPFVARRVRRRNV